MVIAAGNPSTQESGGNRVRSSGSLWLYNSRRVQCSRNLCDFRFPLLEKKLGLAVPEMPPRVHLDHAAEPADFTFAFGAGKESRALLGKCSVLSTNETAA